MSNTKYYMDGFAPPTGVQNSEQVATIQRMLGIEDDGIWGSQTELAYRSYMNAMSRSPKKEKANPYQAVTALTNAAKESGRTYGSPGYTANSFPNAPIAYSSLTNVSKEYGKTFGNPGYIPKQVQTAPSTPKQQAEALTNASIDHRTTFGNPGFTPAYLRSLPISQVDAYTALTQASKANQTTFGNPGFVNSNKVNKDDLPKDPQLALEKIIDASSLSNKDKWRAKYVIDGMDSEVLQGLLQDVLRDGVAPYFSQNTWEERAALMMSPEENQQDQQAIAALTNASIKNGRTFGNPGFAYKFAMQNLEPYFTSDKIASRTVKDQTVMEALKSLYLQKFFAGETQDLEKILFHIDNYEYISANRNNDIMPEEFEWKYSDGVYNPAPEYTGNKATGYISANYLTENDLYKHGGQGTQVQELFGNIVQLISEAVIPPATILSTYYDILKELGSNEYYKFNPGTILQEGDVGIYFNPYHSEYGFEYFYRNGELLYAKDQTAGKTIFGKNYFGYADELEKNMKALIDRAFADIIIWIMQTVE